MITGPGNTCEHTGPSQHPASLSPRCCWLCFARRVPWRAHSSFLPLKEPFLGCSFSETGGRNEFLFRSGLRGEESLSCLAQGWDALNKGAVAAVKNPMIVGGGCSSSSHMLSEDMGTTAAYHNTAIHTELCSLPLCMCLTKGQFKKQRQLFAGSPPSCTVIAELCSMVL